VALEIALDQFENNLKHDQPEKSIKITQLEIETEFQKAKHSARSQPERGGDSDAETECILKEVKKKEKSDKPAILGGDKKPKAKEEVKAKSGTKEAKPKEKESKTKEKESKTKEKETKETKSKEKETKSKDEPKEKPKVTRAPKVKVESSEESSIVLVSDEEPEYEYVLEEEPEYEYVLEDVDEADKADDL
jgi:hypothetical protein